MKPRLTLTCAALLGCAAQVACAPPAAVRPAATPAEIPALETQVAADSSRAELWLRLGEAYRAAGRAEDARNALERALRLDPASGRAIVALGLAYEDASRFADARRLYEGYIEAKASGDLKRELRERLPVIERRELEAQVRAAVAREAALANTPAQPRTVGVFPFIYEGEDPTYEPLSRALAELLTTDLAQVSRLTLLERLNVQLLLNELSLADSGYVDPATAARTGRIAGAARIVQGRIDGAPAQLRLTARVVPTDLTRDSLGTPVQAEEPAARIIDAEKQLALDILASMGVQLTTAERQRVLERPTQNIQALLAYGLGLEADDAGRFEEAASHFSDARRLDPGFQAAARASTAAANRALGARMNADALQRLANLATPQAGASSWAERRAAFDPIEAMLPDARLRDATTEVLGTEGLDLRLAIITLIFHRP